MILARMVFQCRWGKSGEVAREFVENMEMVRRLFGGRIRILTDLSGGFHRVVQEIEVESLAELEQGRAALFSSPEFQQRQAQMMEEYGLSEPPFESGYVEFFTIEGESG